MAHVRQLKERRAEAAIGNSRPGNGVDRLGARRMIQPSWSGRTPCCSVSLLNATFRRSARLNSRQLKEASIKSNEVLKELGSDIQWVESYIADDKIFCVYLAVSEEMIREHARRSGFPANRVIPVKRRIDPTTASSSVGAVPLGHV